MWLKEVKDFIENENRLGRQADVDEILCKLVDYNRLDKTKLRLLLDNIKDLMKADMLCRVKFSKNVIYKILELLIVDKGVSPDFADVILVCVKEYLFIFAEEQNKDIIDVLWTLATNIHHHHGPKTLVHFFYLFVYHICSIKFTTKVLDVIQHLLSSLDKTHLKTAIHLMGKYQAAIKKNLTEESEDIIKALGWRDKLNHDLCWSVYIEIWELLDNPIIPYMEYIRKLELLIANTSVEWQRTWFELIYMYLLSRDDLKVINLTLEYIMTCYEFTDLSLRLRRQFLLASNNVQLFDVSGHFFSYDIVKSFLDNAITPFIECFITIDSWQFVPTYFWFKFFDEQSSISYGLLMRLAKFLRTQSLKIRTNLQKILLRDICPSIQINSLSISEYIAFIETLYDIDDGFHNARDFMQLLNSKSDLNLTCFSKRFYKIFTSHFNNYEMNNYAGCIGPMYNFELTLLCHRLKNVPKTQHGWFRFVLVFNLEQSKFLVDFCRTCYGLDLLKLKNLKLSLPDFYLMISEKLIWNPEDEVNYIYSKCVDLYTEFQLKKWSDMEKLILDPLQLIAMGNSHTFTRLLILLGEHDTPNVSECVLDGFLRKLKEKYLHQKVVCELFMRHIHKYAINHMSETEWENLAFKIINLDPEHKVLTAQVVERIKISKELLIRGLLHGEPSKGVKRIEEAYEELILQKRPTSFALRQIFKSIQSPNINKDIIDDLLHLNNDLSKKITDYHENSKFHRLKIRIAQAIYDLYDLYKWDYWSEELWTALLTAHHQFNVRLLYILLIVKLVKNAEQILEKLRQIDNYDDDQQISLLYVVYNYFMIYWPKEYLSEARDLLKSLAFGRSDHIHIIAHVVLRAFDDLISNRTSSSVDYIGVYWMIADNETQDILMHPGLKMFEFYLKSPTLANDMVLFATNAPFDECNYQVLRTCFDCQALYCFGIIRKKYMKKMKEVQNVFIPQAEEINLDFGPYTLKPKPIKEILFKTNDSKIN